MNKISKLLIIPFTSRRPDEQLRIKELGRPLPNLDIIKKNCKGRTRKFSRPIYSKNDWLCGCEEKNAFFCFPCVLFGGDSSWTNTGITDISHIWDKMRTHEKSKSHIDNVFSLSLLGKSNILVQVNAAYRLSVGVHNEKVDKNRYALNGILNCIRFCGALELALRGQDEADETEKKGVFRELIDFSAHLDKDLKEHLSKSLFKDSFRTMQAQLMQCMLEVYQQEVIKEIKTVDFVAVIIDETTDVSSEFLLVIILRYVLSGKPVERFWNFVDPPGYDVHSISKAILKEIEPLFSDNPNKLISQSYDGASVMIGGLRGLQKQIQEKYPLANYVHYYAHHINLVMRSASAINRSVRIFFAHLAGICSFFSTSAYTTNVIDEIRRTIPWLAETKWNFNSTGGVNSVYEHRQELIMVMETLEFNENVKMDSVIEQAGAYKLRLKDKDFIFWLTVFHKIMPHVDYIFNQFQSKTLDPLNALQEIENFEIKIKKIQSEMDGIISSLDWVDFDLEYFENDEKPPRKRPRNTIETEKRKMEALQICDSIVEQIKTRFSFSGHLIATNLFVIEHFTKFYKCFPYDLSDEVTKVYQCFDKNRLRTELRVLYARNELRNISGAVSLLSLILQDGIRDAFPQTIKLLKLLLTTPMSTPEEERCFTILKRIRTFLRNSLKQDNLGTLGMLSVEKAFLNNIENYNKLVMDLFGKINIINSAEFVYREPS